MCQQVNAEGTNMASKQPHGPNDWERWSGIRVNSDLEFVLLEAPGILRQVHLSSIDFLSSMTEIHELPRFHGKQWQYHQVLRFARSRFAKGFPSGKAQACGFGVGKEPIPAALASQGWNVLATDYLNGPGSSAWRDTEQMLSNRLDLNDRKICKAREFEDRVNFKSVDMSDLPSELHGRFDFIWSTCALGHIGGYRAGLEFILESAKLLRPGGVAVHTTEVDLSEQGELFDTAGLSLYRRVDLARTLDLLQSAGLMVPTHGFSVGPGEFENIVDRPPYSEMHLRIEVCGREVLPFAVVFERPSIGVGDSCSRPA